MTAPTHRSRCLGPALAAAGILIGAATLSACGNSSPAGPVGPVTGDAPTAGTPVLPTTKNPISNTSTADTLRINSVLVENNVDASGAAATDHLEVALSNTGASPLTRFEVYYTFEDPKTHDSEGYYAKLPAGFVIPAKGQRVAHFDDTSAPDHFPVNEFSLYSTDTNALNVTVTVSAADAAIQTVTVKKDAGGPETAD